MIFKPATWYRIALALSVVNLLGAGFAVGRNEMMHAGVHVVLTAGFWFWAERLRRSAPGGTELEGRVETLNALETEVAQMRQELNEVHERLDFAERLLAQGSEARRMGPQR